MTRPIFTLLLAAGIAATLAACGGGSGADGSHAVTPPPPPPPPPVVVHDGSGARGALIDNPPARVASLDAAGLVRQIGLFGTFGRDMLAVAGTPQCGIDVHHFEYSTVGAAGEVTSASGALMVPTGAAAPCSGSHPVLLYGHGSSLERGVDMALIEPSASYGGSAASIAALFAAHGYIVVAPNYAGYDTSTLSYHPQHIADQQSKDMIDALTAARKAFASLPNPVADNGKLFLSGYSEGGYVTMATHRAMQAAGMHVTASAPLSGNYAESVGYEQLGSPGALDNLAASAAQTRESVLNLIEQITAWQKAYGNLYTSAADIYPASLAARAETLVPSTQALASLQVPAFLLAKDMPNYAGLSAAQQAYYGAPDQSLLKTSFVTAMLADMAANPCPVTSASAPLACTPSSPVRQAWLKNDLRTWTPTAPMLMCGGNGDPEVSFDNTPLTMAYFAAHGLAAGTASVLDVDTPTSTNDSYATAKSVFVAAKARVVAGGGNPATPDNYHGYMTFAACHVAARDFFAKF